MRAPWFTWVWPISILLSTSAMTLLIFWFPEEGIRPLVVMGFLFLIPGMTVVRFFHTREAAVEWMLAIALSFVIDAFVAGIVLYAGQWSPTHIMSFLIGFCFSGAVAQLAILRPTTTATESVSFNKKTTQVRIASQDTQSIKTNVDTQDVGDNETSVDTQDVEDNETSVFPENMEDPEDTKERPVILLPLLQENTQEKTVRLEKPQLSGKKASRG